MSVQGHCDPAFEAVRSVFAAGFDTEEELGAGVAVYAGDRLVVDLWGGVADRKTSRPWLHDTPCLAFSCTKAVTATAALLLAERGRIHIRTGDRLVARLPGPGATAGHLLSHQVGSPAFDRTVLPEEAHDPAAMAALLAAQEPIWTPGEAHGYHALTFGGLPGDLRHFSGMTSESSSPPRSLPTSTSAPPTTSSRGRRGWWPPDPEGRPSEGQRCEAQAAGRPERSADQAAGRRRRPDEPDEKGLRESEDHLRPRREQQSRHARCGLARHGHGDDRDPVAGFYRNLIAGRIPGHAA